MACDSKKLFEFYLTARQTVIDMGYVYELDWQDSRDISKLTETEFLTEAAWVILSSGMRETIIRRRFPMVSHAFLDWVSADLITQNRTACEARGIKAFNNPPKIYAIGSLCSKVYTLGFNEILRRMRKIGIQFLQEFEFIGPVTKFHLAKNIGLEVVKPDRHLVRLAKLTEFNSPTQLCQEIANMTGDKLSVVDLTLWRYCTLNNHYGAIFRA